MSAYVDATVIASAVVVFSGGTGLMAWIYRRGRSEGNFEKSLVDNTRATEALNQTVGGLKDSLDVGFRQVHDRIDKHDVEIAVARRDIEHLTASVIVAHRPLDS